MKGLKGDGLLRRGGTGDALASGLAVAALALLAGFISLPFISLLLWTASENAWRAMASPVALDALLLSIKTTSISMAIILTVGTPAAYVLARAEFPGKKIVETLVDVPAVLPPSAAGIALLLAFGRFGLVGQHLEVLGVTVTFTTAAVMKVTVTTNTSRCCPTSPNLPKVSSSAMPAAEGGSTAGMSTRVSTIFFPGNSARAST